jgi:hypothetical protein
MEGLSARRAREMLGRVRIAAYYAGHDTTYVRARFEGNGKAVAYWDEDTKSGVVRIDDEIEEFDSLDPPWPDWYVRVGELESEVAHRGPAERSA